MAKWQISTLWRHAFARSRVPLLPPDADVQAPEADPRTLGKFVFLSHTSADAPVIAASVIPVLVNEGFFDVHFSNRTQAPSISSLYKARLLTSLGRCRWFMVFVTPASIKSEWVRFEVDWASRHRSRDEVVVITSAGAKAKSLNRWLARAPHVAFDVRAGADQSELRRVVGAWAKRRDAEGALTPPTSK